MTDQADEAARIQEQLQQARRVAAAGHDALTVAQMAGISHTRAQGIVEQVTGVGADAQKASTPKRGDLERPDSVRRGRAKGARSPKTSGGRT